MGIVICLGGGYQYLAIDKEGHDIARWLTTIGICRFGAEVPAAGQAPGANGADIAKLPNPPVHSDQVSPSQQAKRFAESLSTSECVNHRLRHVNRAMMMGQVDQLGCRGQSAS